LYPGLLETIKIVEKQMGGENRTRAGKLRWMMKRTQMKKPDFFCDIEFVTVAMVFVSVYFS
jgi:hypothetical protein